VKIAIVASSRERLDSVGALVKHQLPEDQVMLLQREGEDLRLDRLDIDSTGIVIVDGAMPDDTAIKTIADRTKERINPAFIYLLQNYQIGALEALIHAGVSDVIRLDAIESELLPAVERIRRRSYLTSPYQPRGKVLTFIACKGGVGSTFVATNLAYVLAEHFDKRVLFVDLHMQDGDAAFYLLKSTRNGNLGDIIRLEGLDSTAIASTALQVTDRLFLLQAPDSPERSSGITDQHVEHLISVAVQDYDYVVIDIAHILDSVNMRALDRAETIFLVMQPLTNYLRAAVKQLHLFSLLGYPKQRTQMILNRMDHQIDLTVAQMQSATGQSIEHIIPEDFRKAVESVNLGIPLVKLDERSPVTKSLIELASKITGESRVARGAHWIANILRWWRS